MTLVGVIAGGTTRSKLTKISGIVIPVDWDEKGNVIAAAIATRDEDEYRIEKSGMGEKLLGLIHEVVNVSGEVRTQEGRKIIKVKTCSLQKAHDQQSIH